MPTADELGQEHRRLEMHRAMLTHYLNQVSQLGVAYTPPGVIAGLADARDGVARCKATLRAWGEAVEDQPDDEATSAQISAVVAFGEGSQIGDVTVRDITGGDRFNFTVNLYHSAPSELPATLPEQEDTPVVGTRTPPLAAAEPSLQPLKSRDPRLLAIRVLAASERWAEVVKRYETLAEEGLLPAQDVETLDRARWSLWLPQTLEQAEAAEARLDWEEALELWQRIAGEHPDRPEFGTRLARVHEEQMLALKSRDAAALIDQMEWEEALATLESIAQQRAGYIHPRIDLIALWQQAEAALAYERAVEQAGARNWAEVIATLEAVPPAATTDEMLALLHSTRAVQAKEQAARGDWVGVIVSLETIPDAVATDEVRGLLKLAHATYREEERKKAQAAADQRADEERRRQEHALLHARAALVEARAKIEAGEGDAALALLRSAMRHFQPDVASLAARMAEIASISFGARLQAAVLAGRLGDPRVPVTPEQWWRELERRSEDFGAQVWTNVPPAYWCYIPAGSYLIGGWGKSEPAAEIRLKPYWIARLPITVAQSRQFFAEPGRKPARWGEKDLDCLNQAAVHMSGRYAMACCAWLTEHLVDVLPEGYVIRLPSEAEWETAASFDGSARRRPYPWGHEEPTPERAIYNPAGVAPIGCCPAGAAACGALDLAGNVWEMTGNDFGAYPAAAHAYQYAAMVPWRGGSWYSSKAFTHCGARTGYPQDFSHYVSGFRVVLGPGFADKT